jgi:hypothetical protein
MGLYVPWSDDDSEEEHDNETTKHVTAFTGGCEFDEDYNDDDVSYDELADSYIKLYAKIEEICLKGEKQKKIIAILEIEKEKLLSTISGLQDMVNLLTFKLYNMTKYARMLNTSYEILDEMRNPSNTHSNTHFPTDSL